MRHCIFSCRWLHTLQCWTKFWYFIQISVQVIVHFFALCDLYQLLWQPVEGLIPCLLLVLCTWGVLEYKGWLFCFPSLRTSTSLHHVNDSFNSDIATHRVKSLVDWARDYLTRGHTCLMHVLVLFIHIDGARTSSKVKLAGNVHLESLGLRLHHLTGLDYVGQSHCVL